MAVVQNAEFDYAVVGAGPAGLAAAGFLAKAGNRVAVFEGRPRPQDVFGSYPVVLNSRGLSALERLGGGVLERVNEIGMAVEELHIVPKNRTVARVPTWGTGIMRDQASQVLLEAAEERENITFFWEHRLLSIDFASKALTFQKEDGSEVTFVVPRLVAADGNRSRVRRACEADVPDFSAEADPWGFNLRFMNSRGKPDQTAVSPAHHFVLGDKGYVCQQPNGVWSISLRVLPDGDEEFLTAEEATEERVQQLKAYVEEHARFVADNLLDEEAYRGFYACRAFDGVVVKCSCLNPAGWVCLIGDAAHAVQPATGEGINSGLEDAAVLAQALAERPEDPFAAYNDLRLADAHGLQAIAMQAKEKVVAPAPRKQAENVIVTIGLGIAKKMHIIEGTSQDYMLGEKARTNGVKGYAELVEMEARQSRGLRKFARGLGRLLRLPKEAPPAPAGEAAARGAAAVGSSAAAASSEADAAPAEVGAAVPAEEAEAAHAEAEAAHAKDSEVAPSEEAVAVPAREALTEAKAPPAEEGEQAPAMAGAAEPVEPTSKQAGPAEQASAITPEDDRAAKAEKAAVAPAGEQVDARAIGA